ncbi:hypothetical protein OEZ86_004858 [Tetradesmus obliquus]|nr:hypothetical protein OEZ86_004858 [Tetradesmus obliquus]
MTCGQQRRALALLCFAVLQATLLSLQLAAAAPVLPQSVGTSYKAAYHYVQCEADYVIEPGSTQELADAIKAYKQLAEEKGAQLKVRVSRRLFHSTTSFVCPAQLKSFADSPENKPNVISVAVLHERLNTTLSADPEKFTMRIGAGMKLREFTAEATRNGMSVQIGSLPAYAGLTMAGVMSTSGHGSGDNATSNICDTLISITWVDANGNVRTSSRDSEEGRLFCGGMGLIGVMTELDIQMTPPTHTKLITRYLANDTDIVGDIEKMLKVSPHMLVFWRPDMKLYSAYMLKPVSTSVPAGDAHMTLLPNYKGRTNMAHLFRVIQEDIFDETMRYSGIAESVLCPTVAANSVAKTWASDGKGEDVLFAVGKTNELASTECWDDCAWNGPAYNGTAEDVHLSIEWDDFQDWTTDLKNMFKYDLWETEYDKGRCLGPGYIWLRFGHGGPDYLSMHYDMKRPVYVQSTWLKSRAVMDRFPMRYGFITDLLEEVSLCKYKGRPHWGKNFARTFTHPSCSIKDRYPRSFDKVLELQKQHDPAKVFEPELWQKIRKQESFKMYPRCALDKTCYCQEDIHCPEQHRCIPSRAPGLESYKVCKPDWRLLPESGRA